MAATPVVSSDQITIPTGVAIEGLLALERYEQILVARQDQFGRSRAGNQELGATRCSIVHLNRALGFDPVAESAKRAGFNRKAA